MSESDWTGSDAWGYLYDFTDTWQHEHIDGTEIELIQMHSEFNGEVTVRVPTVPEWYEDSEAGTYHLEVAYTPLSNGGYRVVKTETFTPLSEQ